MTSHSSPDPVTLNPLGMRQRARTVEVQSPVHWAASTQYATVLCSGCVSLCYARVHSRPVRDRYKWPDPVTVDALGVRNGPAMAS